MKNLENYYNNYDEDGRLLSQHGQVEYRTTMKYIHDMLTPDIGAKILEVGAGTGRYSVQLANENYDVDAVELIPHNLEIMNSKICGLPNIKTHLGNALDLSMFSDDTYDAVLLLGPMYHLHSMQDKEKALSEAVRVTKKGGHIFVAYCMNETIVINFIFKRGNLDEYMKRGMLSDTFKCKSDEAELFDPVRLEDINELNSTVNVTRIKLVATDGATNYMRECIDNMDTSTFEMWIKFHLATCERQDLIGATNHCLDILRKE